MLSKMILLCASLFRERICNSPSVQGKTVVKLFCITIASFHFDEWDVGISGEL